MVVLQAKFKTILTQTHLFQTKTSSGALCLIIIMTSYLHTRPLSLLAQTKTKKWI